MRKPDLESLSHEKLVNYVRTLEYIAEKAEELRHITLGHGVPPEQLGIYENKLFEAVSEVSDYTYVEIIKSFNSKKDQVLDLSSLTAEQAARKLHQYLVDQYGAGEHCLLLDPDHSERLGLGRCWRVLWEEGPFEWAISVLGGCGINDFANGRYSGTGEEIRFDSEDWTAEPHYSFDIGFYE